MSPNAIPLGAFELKSVMASGGTSSIWKGVHVKQQIPVAVKILRGPLNDEQMGYFYREIQAIAQLDHPCIVRVYDFGRLPEGIEEQSNGMLKGGSPYFVMEYASRGALKHIRRPFNFTDVSNILLSILEALSHAHARGVIHRDIKPSNILLGSSRDLRHRIKLSDFGLAFLHPHHLDAYEKSEVPHERYEEPSGTAWYMAPEQILGNWRSYGPWTDLYALGIVAYELVSGYLPFDAPYAMTVMMHHLKDEIPELKAQIPIPDGFEAWLAKMTAKEPFDRFLRASDAAWSLAKLSYRGPRRPSRRFRSVTQLPPIQSQNFRGRRKSDLYQKVTPALAQKIQADQASLNLARDYLQQLSQNQHPPLSLSKLVSLERPPFPWHLPFEEECEPPIQLTDIGLGIYHWRKISMVNRQREKERLWKSLGEVIEQRRPQWWLIRGLSGIGKSKLVQWLCETAHSEGLALSLYGDHDEGTYQGLSFMIADFFRCIGLDEGSIIQRVDAYAKRWKIEDPLEIQALREFILLSKVRSEPKHSSFGRARDRYEVLIQLFKAMTRERGVIVWLDNIQWGVDALSFCEYLLEKQEELEDWPVLFMLVAREESLVSRPFMAKRLEGLTKQSEVHSLFLSGLDRDAMALLIRRFLALHPDLIQTVMEHAQGNALYAISLIGDWIQKKVLISGPQGFEWTSDQKIEVPENLEALWHSILELLVDTEHSNDLLQLQLAAVLGQIIDESEIKAASWLLGMAFKPQYFDKWTRAYFLKRLDHGWRFEHDLFRKSLLNWAKKQGHWAMLHRACAEMLSAPKFHQINAEIEARRAQHLLAAEEYLLAIDALLQAALIYQKTGQPEKALETLTHREQVIWSKVHLSVPERDLLEGWILFANLNLRLKRWKLAEYWVNKAYERCGELKIIRAKALDIMAFISRQQGALDRSLSYSDEALKVLMSLEFEDEIFMGEVWMNRGHTWMKKGEYPRALSDFREAWEIFDRNAEELAKGRALLNMGQCLIPMKRCEEAHEVLKRAEGIFKAHAIKPLLQRVIGALREECE